MPDLNDLVRDPLPHSLAEGFVAGKTDQRGLPHHLVRVIVVDDAQFAQRFATNAVPGVYAATVTFEYLEAVCAAARAPQAAVGLVQHMLQMKSFAFEPQAGFVWIGTGTAWSRWVVSPIAHPRGPWQAVEIPWPAPAGPSKNR